MELERESDWRRSERMYAFKQGEERRHEWLAFHKRQASVFEALAAEHKAALGS